MVRGQETKDETVTRWRLTVEYHGAGFVGWQVQPNGPSIQAELERAGQALFGHPVHVAGSGRTDAGVHALGQVAALNTTARRSARAVRDGLNAHLPPGIACVDAVDVPLAFDPRRWVTSKCYRYTWLDRPSRSPLWQDRAWHVRERLDVDAMAEAASMLRGQHDFSAFRAAGCQARHPTRTLDGATVCRDGDLVHFDVHGNGFLRHMVRILAGTLKEVGASRQPASWFGEVLRSQDRERAGRTAPAWGLCLVRVDYGDGPQQGRYADVVDNARE